MRWCVAGADLRGACRITVLPQASGAAIALHARGSPGRSTARCRARRRRAGATASDRTPGLSAGMISPVICVVSAAASRRMTGGEMDIEAGPGRGRADLLGHRLGEMGRPHLEDVGGLHQKRAPLARTSLGPGRKRPRGRLDYARRHRLRSPPPPRSPPRRSPDRDAQRLRPEAAATRSAVDDEINLHGYLPTLHPPALMRGVG